MEQTPKQRLEDLILNDPERKRRIQRQIIEDKLRKIWQKQLERLRY